MDIYPGTNADVFDPNPHQHDGRIGYLYFYYVKFLGDGQPYVRHYAYCKADAKGDYVPLMVDDNTMAELLKVARADKDDTSDNTDDTVPPGTPVRVGRDFMEISWKHISHVVLMFDTAMIDTKPGHKPVWSLGERIYAGQKRGACVDFLVGGDLQANHSFYDAGVWKEPGTGKEALHFVNYLLRDTTGVILDETDEPQKFKFNVLYDVLAARKFVAMPSIGFILDPGGTNFGPPLKP